MTCSCRAQSILLRLRRALATQAGKKSAKLSSALPLEHAWCHLERMVQARVLMHAVQRSHRAALGVGGPVHATIHARIDHEAGTHEARLKRYIHGAAREPPTPQCPGSLGHRSKLRMRGRVFIKLAAVVGPRNHMPLIHHHGANGHLALGSSRTSLLKGGAHEQLVSYTRIAVHSACVAVARSDLGFFRMQLVHMRPLAGIRDCQFTFNVLRCYHYQSRRDGRAVECGGLENR